MALLLVTGMGCSSDDPDIAAPDSSDATRSQGDTLPTDARPVPTQPGAVFLVASADEALDVKASPQGSAPTVKTLAPDEQISGNVVCLVSQELGDDWLEVYLPTAPAGQTGWVERADVSLSRHRFRAEVSRSKHRLTVYGGEVEALSAPAAIGADAPEAGQQLFITDLIKPPDPAGPYGSYAYGLAGSSNDQARFRSGSGVVAIHGTNDPTTLGKDVPSGSIAVGADILTRLVSTIGLPLGTPVDIID